jgi:hypothetical protein
LNQSLSVWYAGVAVTCSFNPPCPLQHHSIPENHVIGTGVIRWRVRSTKLTWWDASDHLVWLELLKYYMIWDGYSTIVLSCQQRHSDRNLYGWYGLGPTDQLFLKHLVSANWLPISVSSLDSMRLTSDIKSMFHYIVYLTIYAQPMAAALQSVPETISIAQLVAQCLQKCRPQRRHARQDVVAHVRWGPSSAVSSLTDMNPRPQCSTLQLILSLPLATCFILCLQSV